MISIDKSYIQYLQLHITALLYNSLQYSTTIYNILQLHITSCLPCWTPIWKLPPYYWNDLFRVKTTISSIPCRPILKLYQIDHIKLVFFFSRDTNIVDKPDPCLWTCMQYQGCVHLNLWDEFQRNVVQKEDSNHYRVQVFGKKALQLDIDCSHVLGQDIWSIYALHVDIHWA